MGVEWKASMCLIDTDNHYLEELEELYLSSGYDVVGTMHTDLYWQLSSEEKLDLLVLVMNSNNMGSLLEMMTQIRDLGHETGIVILTESDYESFVLKAFEYGADECVSIHKSPKELLWRAKVVLRRVIQNFDYLSYDEIFMIPAKRELRINHVPVHISQLHYQLLLQFMRFQTAYLSRRYLAEHVWGKTDMDDKPINTAVCRLNKDLYPHVDRQLILCKRDFGYYLSSRSERKESRQLKCKW